MRPGQRPPVAGVLAACLTAACLLAACTESAPPTPAGHPPGGGATGSLSGRSSSLSGSAGLGTGARQAAPVPSSLPAPPAPPALPSPSPLVPIASVPMTGEGQWQPAGDPLRNGYGLYTTQLRPADGYPAAGIAWIDPAVTRTVLYAGSSEPSGTWTAQGSVAPPDQTTLLAAFNAGFRIYAYSTGWYDQGQAAVPLVDGAASLVIYSDGSATVADWGRDATPGPNVVAVRQNLKLLVDHGAPVPDLSSYSNWGAVLGGGVSTWRSGLGVTAAGDLVYVAGPELGPAFLANLLVAAGSVRAMELDINPEWVSFAAFTHNTGTGVTGTNLLGGMHFGPSHYLQGSARDFFAIFAR